MKQITKGPFEDGCPGTWLHWGVYLSECFGFLQFLCTRDFSCEVSGFGQVGFYNSDPCFAAEADTELSLHK